MKKTIYLSILKEIFTPFFLGLTVFTSVLLMGRIIQLANLVIAKGVPLADVMKMILFMLPNFSMATIPMAFLLSVLLAFGRLSSDSETTAMKACGISLYGMLPPVIITAICATIATMFITVYALPRGNTAFRALLYNVVETRVTLSIKDNVFNDSFPGLTIYTNNYDEQSYTMSGVLIHDERDSDSPSTIFAEKGYLISDQTEKLLRLKLQNGNIHQSAGPKDYRLIGFDSYTLSIDLKKSPRLASQKENDMTLGELQKNLADTKIDPKMRREMMLELQRRFALPFACLVFALAGVPLGMQNQRSGKAGGYSLAIGVIILYYILLSAGKNLGEKGVIAPFVAMWAPNIIFTVFGVYAFRMAAEERSIPLFSLFHTIIGRLRSFFARGKES